MALYPGQISGFSRVNPDGFQVKPEQKIFVKRSGLRMREPYKLKYSVSLIRMTLERLGVSCINLTQI